MFRRTLVAAVGVCVIAMWSGCGSSSSTPTKPVITVTLTSSAGQLDVNGQVNVSAQVANDTSGVTFSDPAPKSAGGCSGAGLASGQCGTITKVDSTHATYTAPAGAVSVVITAASAKDATKTGSVAIIVNAAPTIAAPTSAQLTATIGTAYSLSLGSGGTAPFTWSITSGSLPSSSGLALNTSANTGSAVITGTPTMSAVNETLTVQVKDAANVTASQTFTITIPIVISTATPLPNGEVTQAAYTSGALAFAGGSGVPATSTPWSITSGNAGLTAAGLSQNATTGAITGSPTATCSPCAFTVQVTDNTGAKGTKDFNLTIVPRVSVAAPAAASLQATIGSTYTLALNANAGTGLGAVSKWKLASGSLPVGLSPIVSGTGVIAGTPTDAASSPSFTVTVTDAAGVTSAPSAPITVAVAIPITTSSLKGGEAGAKYNSGALAANTGSGSGITWSATGLPTWAAINASTGAITGADPVSGTSSVDVTVKDTNGATGTANLSLVVNPRLAITSSGALTPAVVNSPYNGGSGVQLVATGGVTPLGTWAGPASGSLPPGLSVSSSGVVQGTPACPTGNFNFTVTLGPDAAGVTATSPGLTISTSTTPLGITTSSIPNANVGQPYNQQLATSGGACSATVTWSVVSGALPSWLSLSADGVLSGTPGSGDAGGPTAFTVQASDGTSSPTQALSISVVSPGVNNNQFSGPYAFYARGFDAAGKAIAMVGSFTADGAGGITAGSMDVVHFAGAPSTNLAIDLGTSSYSIGADERGTLTLATSAGTFVFDISVGDLYSFSGPFTSHVGHLISRTANTAISGEFVAQDSSAFTLSAISGDWAFGFAGTGSASGVAVQVAGAGRLTINSDASLSNGVIDVNTNGVVDGGNAGPLSISSGGTLDTSGSIDAATGRATATFTIAGGPTIHQALYVVNSKLVYEIGTDAVDANHSLFSGEARRQSTTWCATTGSCNFAAQPNPLSGVSIVYFESNSNVAGTARVDLGAVTFTSTGAGTGTLSGGFDRNDAGTITTAASNPVSGTYTITADGRATISGSGTPDLYVVDQNTAFALNTGGKVALGYAEPQSPNLPFSFLGGTGGYFCFGTRPPAVSGSKVESGVQVLIPSSDTDAPANPYTYDSNSLLGGLQEAVSVNGVTITADATGRFTFNDGSPKVGYMVTFSAAHIFSRMIVIDADPTDKKPFILVNDKTITQVILP